MTEIDARTGSRIRARRLDLGMKQVDLARACAISAAYLNLIEHNKRSIGGALLVRLSKELAIDASRLSRGAEGDLVAALGTALAHHKDEDAGLESAEELAQRFPAFAGLVAHLHSRNQQLAHQIEMLDDRLTHDPHLSASLHDVLSTVTAIRSTSGILAGDDALEPDWQARFHRNLHEDSQRLADAANGLVRYLDGAKDGSEGATLPQEEVEAWLAARDWRVDALEDDPDAEVDEILSGSGMTGGARVLARTFLMRYAADARDLPLTRLTRIEEDAGPDPMRLAARAGLPLALILRRLAVGRDGMAAAGLILCDASGTLTFRRPVDGFALPRFASACPLWPLFDALRQPQTPVRRLVEQPGSPAALFDCTAISEIRWPRGYEAECVVEAVMLVRPVDVSESLAHPVGTSCRICPRDQCAARREPSILGERQGRAGL